ncbi:hypothetical protein K469DRAFT_701301 [Zopfia rhizophila CBS 207.26]|uniref:Uncharacterized protein n=1 Tax=Zopfia rhizophila CBS 207.26 TaxID=1314779 RepID=A0A6A6D8W8_9PEZI|nr:hypothetical protein K469DRAFT_701301 [Zopfia rhizophila CBS 207.26]
MSTKSPIPHRQLHEVTTLAATTSSLAQDSWSASPSRSVTPSSPKVPNVQWTPEMKQALLATLVQKAVEDGLRADSGVSMDKSITIKHCKTKHDTCKTDYKTYSALKGLSSEVIEDYFKAHPRAQKFRHKPILATGENAASVNNLLTSDNSKVLKELVKRDSTVTPLPSSSES